MNKIVFYLPVADSKTGIRLHFFSTCNRSTDKDETTFSLPVAELRPIILIISFLEIMIAVIAEVLAVI